VPSAVSRVVLAGHPEGHPGLGRSPSLTAAALEAKAAAALAAGLDVTVASQFCLDAAKLVAWLAATREQLRTCAAAAAAAEARADASRPPRVDFRVGVAGPVGGAKLARIAKICDVPSLVLAPSPARHAPAGSGRPDGTSGDATSTRPMLGRGDGSRRAREDRARRGRRARARQRRVADATSAQAPLRDPGRERRRRPRRARARGGVRGPGRRRGAPRRALQGPRGRRRRAPARRARGAPRGRRRRRRGRGAGPPRVGGGARRRGRGPVGGPRGDGRRAARRRARRAAPGRRAGRRRVLRARGAAAREARLRPERRARARERLGPSPSAALRALDESHRCAQK
jgi:hypothetical protein